MNSLPLPSADSLYVDAVDLKPITIFWNELKRKFASSEACECDTCGAILVVNGVRHGAPHSSYDFHGLCGGIVESAEGPQMNYAYPLPREIKDREAATRALAGLPLCLVLIEPLDLWALALTGGGQDLSYEIAEGYVRLGYFPPAHFARLPRMAGRGSKRDIAIAKLAAESCRILASWLRSRAEDDMILADEFERAESERLAKEAP